jgi:hypothetical protein
LISKEIVHAATSLDGDRAGLSDFALLARGQRASSRSTGCGTPYAAKTLIPDTPGTARRSWPLSRNLAISLLHLTGSSEITRTQAIGRDRTRMLSYLPL